MMNRFLASGITCVIVLASLSLLGTERVFDRQTDHNDNLQKYIQTQRWILNNYVDEVDVDVLYKDSIRGMVTSLDDSTLSISGTPIDTTFTDVSIADFRESAVRFERAYSYLASLDIEVDYNKATEASLKGMFKSLDPYTDYIDPEASDRVRENFAGKFQGIGVQFDILNDTITVISPISGGPSDQLGIRSGDRIISIDDETAVGFSQEDVLNTLRGPKGSVVKVGILRPRSPNILTYNITRDDIPLFTIDTSYLLDEKTGYIKVNRFASTTYEEFMEAMENLTEAGMERLVLDMRYNPGGYLDQAVNIVSEFFPRGTELVSTKSRHTRFSQSYATRRSGNYQDMPLIVMVNEGSASGSEIVAGALQDNDRGLVVGSRTFGKGLVQQQYELVDKSFIRVTISRYYTPSGRLIQKPYHGGREEYVYEIYNRDRDASTDVENFVSELPDSLVYTTRAGRAVYGGGGIVPDHIVQADTTRSYVLGFMRQHNLGLEFVRDFLDREGESFREEWEDRFEDFRTDFSWTDKDMDIFWTLMENNGMVVSDTTTAAIYKDEKMYINPEELKRDRWIPENFTKAELARQIWGSPYFYNVYNDGFDTALKQTVDLWDEVSRLQAYVEEYNKTKASQRGGIR